MEWPAYKGRRFYQAGKLIIMEKNYQPNLLKPAIVDLIIGLICCFQEKNKHEMYRPISDLYCCLRMWSLVGHFGVMVCLPVLLWLVFTRAGRELEESVEVHLTHKLWFTTPVALTAIFLGLSYLLILCEVCISRTRPYIANLMHIHDARSYVHDMRKVGFGIQLCKQSLTELSETFLENLI